jgi:class 3 adenylate cyclase/tetratricopeptide (TPR) repeat protein
MAPVAEVRKTVTVLFADVTGSTSLGERLDPEALRRVMVRFYEVARDVVQRHGGTVEKFIGDAVMAVFGVPQVHEDDPIRAARAAVELRDRLAILNDELARVWGARLQLRTGINTGSVLAGDPASGQTFVSGDAVNVAARLEQAAEPDEILIGADTVRLARDALRVETIEPLVLKGKAEPVTAFRLLEVVAGAPTHARSLDSPMVGREGELQQVMSAFEAAEQTMSCRLVTVLGVAGVGKSRLIREAASLLADRALLLNGHCLPYGEGITFWPIAEMVRQASGIATSDSPSDARAKVATLLSGLEPAEAALVSQRVCAAVGLGATDGAIQETFWAVRRMLEALAIDHPVIAVLEDIHWAESTLLDLLEYMTGFSRGQTVLILCTARPDIREDHPEWGRAGSTVTLEPLDAAETERLISGLFKDTQLPDIARKRIVHAAEGNPLFIEEMVRMLVDSGLLRIEEGHWAARGDLMGIAAPGTISALISARLDRLQDQERAVLQRAAVVGKVFYWGAVAELSPLEERDVVGRDLQTLVRKELIRPEPSPFVGEDAFEFSHVLVHMATYESIPKRIRADLHARFAQWLVRTSGQRLPEFEEIVGYHFERASQTLAELATPDEPARAIASQAGAHLASAGQRAFSRGDMRAAANLITRATTLLGADDPSRIDMLATLGQVLIEAGDWTGAEAALLEAQERARDQGDRRVEALASVRAQFIRLVRMGFARNVDAIPEIERCVTVFDQLHDDGCLAEAFTLLGQIDLWAGRAARAVIAADRAVQHASRAHDRRREALALRLRAAADRFGPTPVDEAAQRCAEVMDGPAVSDRVLRAAVAGLFSEIENLRGNFDIATRLAQEMNSLTVELGLGWLGAAALRAAAAIATLNEDHRAAAQLLHEGVEILRQLGDPGHLSSMAPLLADALYALGRVDEALALSEESESITMGGDIDAEVGWRRVRSKLLAKLGRTDEAVVVTIDALDRVRRTDYLDLHGVVCRDAAEVMTIVGRPADARLLLEEALECFELKGAVVQARETRHLMSSHPPLTNGSSQE